jgi:hypothetical protein
VLQKKGKIPKDGFSRIQQQIEFIFGELMTRIEKLETRFDGERSKRGKEARKEEGVARNSTDEVEDDLNCGGGFRTHRGESMRIGQRGDIFSHIWILMI